MKYSMIRRFSNSLHCTMRIELVNCLPRGECIRPRTGDIEILSRNNFLSNLPRDIVMEVQIVQEGPSGTSRSKLNWTNMSGAVLFYYYIHMPWSQVRFLGGSAVLSGSGYPVVINFQDIPSSLVSVK